MATKDYLNSDLLTVLWGKIKSLFNSHTDNTDIHVTADDKANWNNKQSSGDYMVRGTDYVTAGKKSGTTLGAKSTAEGFGTTASGDVSHAEGSGTQATKTYAHSEGVNTIASGSGSHAEGANTTASGDNSHSEGASNTASGLNSHVGGQGSSAIGTASFVHGTALTATNDSSAMFGKYNEDKSDSIFEIGVGSSSDAKKNALTVSNSGIISAPKFETGSSADSYFQSRRFRGEGNADNYYHAIDFGYPGKDGVQFYEWNGAYDFYFNQHEGKDQAKAVLNVSPDALRYFIVPSGNEDGTEAFAVIPDGVYIFGTNIDDKYASKDVVTQSANGLMSNSDKTKLDGIADGANVNVKSDWNATSGDAQILNKPTTVSGYGITDALTADSTLDASKLSGTASIDITGNAATATKATQDGKGNIIASTYATESDLNSMANSALETVQKTYATKEELSNAAGFDFDRLITVTGYELGVEKISDLEWKETLKKDGSEYATRNTSWSDDAATITIHTVCTSESVDDTVTYNVGEYGVPAFNPPTFLTSKDAANFATTSDLTSHTGNKNNPHGVTMSQLGIHISANTPTSSDGNDGDIWIVYPD